jgi:periplasmic divalent cation tolerance protein
MKTDRFAIGLVTAPNVKVARHIALGALRKKLAACANILPKVESHYWWQGKTESSNELLIVFKTLQTKLPALERFVIAEHPYDTPEFVALPILAGSKRYLDWIAASVAETR